MRPRPCPRLAVSRESARLRLLLIAVVLLAACQPQEDATSPELVTTKTPRTLTIKGLGTGGGTVTAPAYGETSELHCVITNGTSGPEDCVAKYGYLTVVTLTATPDPGSRFTTWGGACSGTAPTCNVKMGASKIVKATFSGSSIPSYTLNIAGG